MRCPVRQETSPGVFKKCPGKAKALVIKRLNRKVVIPKIKKGEDVTWTLSWTTKCTCVTQQKQTVNTEQMKGEIKMREETFEDEFYVQLKEDSCGEIEMREEKLEDECGEIKIREEMFGDKIEIQMKKGSDEEKEKFIGVVLMTEEENTRKEDITEKTLEYVKCKTGKVRKPFMEINKNSCEPDLLSKHSSGELQLMPSRKDYSNFLFPPYFATVPDQLFNDEDF